MTTSTLKHEWPDARVAKFRQAAFVYLHVSILYEGAAYVMMGGGLLPARFGSPWIWLVAGAAVAGMIFFGLFQLRNVWVARIVWVLHGLRLPVLIRGAFFAAPDVVTPPHFYLTAIVVVMINLWMLARAGWDL